MNKIYKPTVQTYDELQQAYDLFNVELFEGKLPECIITLQREKKTCGYFSKNRFINEKGGAVDEIALNPQYFEFENVTEILATLLHEMVHQWQHHLGNASRPGYHNREWATKMQSVGLMPSTTGREGGKMTGFKMSDYPIVGGRFLALVDDLLCTEFKISWRDRFRPMVMDTASGVQALSRPTESIKGLPVLIRDELTQEVMQKQSSRTKFTHECNDQKIENFWGSPSLKVACLKCGKEFKPVM